MLVPITKKEGKISYFIRSSLFFCSKILVGFSNTIKKEFMLILKLMLCIGMTVTAMVEDLH